MSESDSEERTLDLTKKASLRTRIVGTRLGMRESIFLRSLGYHKWSAWSRYHYAWAETYVQSMFRAKIRLFKLSRDGLDIA